VALFRTVFVFNAQRIAGGPVNVARTRGVCRAWPRVIASHVSRVWSNTSADDGLNMERADLIAASTADTR